MLCPQDEASQQRAGGTLLPRNTFWGTRSLRAVPIPRLPHGLAAAPGFCKAAGKAAGLASAGSHTLLRRYSRPTDPQDHGPPALQGVCLTAVLLSELCLSRSSHPALLLPAPDDDLLRLEGLQDRTSNNAPSHAHLCFFAPLVVPAVRGREAVTEKVSERLSVLRIHLCAAHAK